MSKAKAYPALPCPSDANTVAQRVQVVSRIYNTTALATMDNSTVSNVTLRVVVDDTTEELQLGCRALPVLPLGENSAVDHCVAGCCQTNGVCACNSGYSGPRCQYRLQCALAVSVEAGFSKATDGVCSTQALGEGWVQCECYRLGLVAVLRFQYIPVFSVSPLLRHDTMHEVFTWYFQQWELHLFLAVYATAMLVAGFFDHRILYTTRHPAWLSCAGLTLGSYAGYLVRVSSSVLRIFYVVPDYVPHTRVQYVHVLATNIAAVAFIQAALLWRTDCNTTMALITFTSAWLAKIPAVLCRHLFACVHRGGRKGRALRAHQKERQERLLSAFHGGDEAANELGMVSLKKTECNATNAPKEATIKEERPTGKDLVSVLARRSQLAIAADGISIVLQADASSLSDQSIERSGVQLFLSRNQFTHQTWPAKSSAEGAKGRHTARDGTFQKSGWSAGPASPRTEQRSPCKEEIYIPVVQVSGQFSHLGDMVRVTYSRSQKPITDVQVGDAFGSGTSACNTALFLSAWVLNLAWLSFCVYGVILQLRTPMHMETQLVASAQDDNSWQQPLATQIGISLLTTFFLIDTVRVLVKLFATPFVLGRCVDPRTNLFRCVLAIARLL